MKQTTKHRLIGFAAFVVVVVLGIGLFSLWNVWRLREFGVVKEGAIYRSCKPTEAQLRRVARRYGIRTIVSLRWKPDPYSQELLQELGIRYFKVGLDLRKPITGEQIERYLGILDDPQYWPVLVHCGAGEERAGAMVALYRLKRCGWTREQAMEEMKRFDYVPREGNRILVESVLRFAEEKTRPTQTGAGPSGTTRAE